MNRRNIPECMIRVRNEYVREYDAIQPVPPRAGKLNTIEGFINAFQELKGLFPTYVDAYEYLDDTHERIFGWRRYSEYDSFKAVMRRFFRRGRFKSI